MKQFGMHVRGFVMPEYKAFAVAKVERKRDKVRYDEYPETVKFEFNGRGLTYFVIGQTMICISE